jgi:hypothetical protein
MRRENAPLLTVYVPASGGKLEEIVVKGSGIVGSPALDPPRLLLDIDFEGNIYDAVNLERWIDRVARAAERHVAGYPTMARSIVSPDEVIPIGVWHVQAGEIHLSDEGALRQWLGVEDIGPELRWTPCCPSIRASWSRSARRRRSSGP